MIHTPAAPATALVRSPPADLVDHEVDAEVADAFLDVLERATFSAALGTCGSGAALVGASCAVSLGLPAAAFFTGLVVALGGCGAALTFAHRQVFAEAASLGISPSVARRLLGRYLRWGAVPRRLAASSTKARRQLCAAYLQETSKRSCP